MTHAVFLRYWSVSWGSPPPPVFGAELTGTVQVAGRPAQHAVVWLEASGAPAAPTQKVVLDQRNLAFVPHVLAVRVGTTVEFPNNDKVFHNVFSFRDGKKFDLGHVPEGHHRSSSSSTSPGSRGCSATSIRTWPPT